MIIGKKKVSGLFGSTSPEGIKDPCGYWPQIQFDGLMD
jgi:hypothetical protein